MDFLDELNAEIAQITSKESRKAEAERLRKKSRDYRLSTPKRLEAHAEARKLEVAIEAEKWRIIATGALFHTQHCTGCGSKHSQFVQFMEQHQMITKPSTIKWVRSPAIRRYLPSETLLQESKTSVCPDCAIEHGFALETPAKIEKVRGEGFGPSPTYQPDDINEPQEETVQ